MNMKFKATLLGLSIAAVLPTMNMAQTPVYLDTSKPIEERVKDALSRMTLEEKVKMTHAQSKFSSPGVPRLGIPEVWATDGPHGIRPEVLWDEWDQAGWTNDSCIAYPALTCLSATWNPEMSYLYGKSIGEEARYRKKDILLGPGVNIYRTPLNGRNFEYMGEDPYLSSIMVVPYIKGVQENGVAACVKHYALNNQEFNRHTTNVHLSDRALYEIYLPAFKAAVQEGGAWAIMGAYNLYSFSEDTDSGKLYKTQHACHNKRLLQDILRKEWGFDGIVMTDWWAKSNYEGHQAEVTAKAPMVAAQNDIYMVVSDAKSNPENDDVEEMLHAGKITVGELQRNAANILGFLLKSPSVLLLTDRICKEELEAMNTKEEDDVDAGSLVSIESDSVTQKIVIDGALLHPAKGKADVIAVTNEFMGDFTMKFTLKSDLGELAQLPVSVFLDNIHKMTVSVQGTNGKWVEESRILNMEFGHNHYIKFYYGADNLEIKEIVLIPNR